MSDARVEHAIVGFVFWLAFLLIRNPKCSGWETLAMLPSTLLGTWVPDWDLFFGIGFHRSPLTHSAMPVIVLSLFVPARASYAVVVAFGLGIASHLAWDTIYYGNVHWISGRFWDRTLLTVNAVGILIWALSYEPNPAKRKKRKRLRLRGADKEQLSAVGTGTSLERHNGGIVTDDRHKTARPDHVMDARQAATDALLAKFRAALDVELVERLPGGVYDFDPTGWMLFRVRGDPDRVGPSEYVAVRRETGEVRFLGLLGD
jgi:hypothetical protein